jgi:LPS-assembly protein
LRGFAKAVYRDNKFLSRYQNVSYTGCRPGNQDWAVHASELKVNKESGKGSAKNAWVEFKGVPIFYSPYLSFPVDNRRLSGFLSPSFGTTQISGFNATAPYYWNIAPNYDATLSPHYFEKRGVLLAGRFRYLSEMSKGTVNLQYLPEDDILKKARYSGSLKNSSQFSPNLYSNLDLNYVSDDNYFNELGNALISPNFSFVKSAGDVSYVREGLAFSTRFETYQAIDAALTGVGLPYAKLPQVNLNFNHSFRGLPIDAALETESVNFQHVSLIDGQRVNIKPSFSFPLQTASTYLTPKVSLQHSQYFLNHQVAGKSDQLSRTLPILSLDSGLRLERAVNLGDTQKLHTLEPRLFYLYIPKTDQNNLPVFDSSLYDFWFASLFRENRFSGSDRIQDANQVSAALTSRLIDPATGLETLKFNIGQIFYFRNRDVTVPLLINGMVRESPVETSRYSPLVAELSSQLNKHFSIDSGLQWDPETNNFVRGKAELHFVKQPGEIINLGYLYRKNPLIPDHSNDITQTDFSMHWPVYQQWSVVGRWQYSWLYNNTQDSFFGVEKENCCWRFRFIVRRYLNSLNRTTVNNANISNLNVDGSPQTGVFFQVEFKGLTGVGEKLDQFFEKSIYGYRKP